MSVEKKPESSVSESEEDFSHTLSNFTEKNLTSNSSKTESQINNKSKNNNKNSELSELS